MAMFGVNMAIFGLLTSSDSPHPMLKIAHVTFYPLWTLAFLGFFLTFAYRYWNRPTPLNRALAANSYNMYLVHYVAPMSLPLWLSRWTAVPTMAKFAIVSVATVLFSYLTSRFLMKPLATASGVYVGRFFRTGRAV